MLSPERLALPDYEYLGRSFLQPRRRGVQTVRPGSGEEAKRGLSGNGSGWDAEGPFPGLDEGGRARGENSIWDGGWGVVWCVSENV